MAARTPEGPVPLRRRLKDLRRAAVYYSVFAPALTVIERAPWRLLRGVFRHVIEPVAFVATRRLSLRHLEMVYGDSMPIEERRRIARAVVRNFVDGIEETLLALRHGPEQLDARVDDRDAVEAVRALEESSPRGFLGVTGHIGNWEMLGSWLARKSSRGLGAAVAKRLTSPKLNARIERLRRRLGLETLYRDEPPTRPVRLLRSGRNVAVVPDQDVKSLAGIFVEFLGHRAYTPLGPARLALAADVPLVCGFFIREADGRKKIVVKEPIWPDRKAPRAAELERLTRAWSAAIEDMIRRYPDQWAWFHERWRTTPEHLAARGRRELEL